MKIEKPFVCGAYFLEEKIKSEQVNKFVIIFQIVVIAVRIKEWNVR